MPTIPNEDPREQQKHQYPTTKDWSGEEKLVDVVQAMGKAYAQSQKPPSTEVTNYVDKAMFDAEPMKDDLPRVYLLSATPDPLGAVAAASMMYEGRVVRDLSEITDDERIHYWEESFKGHLKAPWEFIDLHFMVEAVTRAFTHQMVRQRTAVYAQESLRFAVKDEVAARPGPIIAADRKSRKTWNEAVDKIWDCYLSLIANGIPAEEARGLLPQDTLTRLHFKTNIRNLAEHMGNRLCTQAQFEWRMVASEIQRAINGYGVGIVYSRDAEGLAGHDKGGDSTRWGASWQFELIANSSIFQPVCFTKGHCPFKASYDRGCTIRDRVDKGEFDQIQTREWMADPTAGWVS